MRKVLLLQRLTPRKHVHAKQMTGFYAAAETTPRKKTLKTPKR